MRGTVTELHTKLHSITQKFEWRQRFRLKRGMGLEGNFMKDPPRHFNLTRALEIV